MTVTSKYRNNLVFSLSAIVIISCSESPQKNFDSSISELNTLVTEIVTNTPVSQLKAPTIFTSYAGIDHGKLRNGQAARLAQWPGVLDTENCTAALIGPRTILTAAHCIDDPKLASPPEYSGAILNWGTHPFPLTCKMNPDYISHGLQPSPADRRGPEDHALCLITLPGGIDAISSVADYTKASNLFETLDMTGKHIREGQPLTMLGFGCSNVTAILTENKITGKMNYKLPNLLPPIETPRVLRIGKGLIAGGHNSTDGLFSSFADNGDTNTAIVCPGDSGGAVFSGNSAENFDPNLSRRVIGINSMTGLVNMYRGTDKWPVSYYEFSEFASVASPSFKKFLDEWIRDTGATKICIEGYSGTQNISTPKRCHI